jgi:hypothetical protein
MAMECLSRWGAGPGYVGFNGWDFNGEPPFFEGSKPWFPVKIFPTKLDDTHETCGFY